MQKRPFQASDINRFVLVGEPQFSPDGTKIIFVRQEANSEDNKSYSTLWLMDSDGSNLRALTHGKKNDRSPRWSPDGNLIAFISGRNEASKIWLLDCRGGEAWELETEQKVNSAPVWAPGGQEIAFVSRDFPHAEEWIPYPGAPENDYARAKEQAEQSMKAGKIKEDDKTSDVKVITRLNHKMDGMGYLGDLRNQIFVAELPEKPGLKPACRQLTTGDFDHNSPTWSPDGAHIFFVSHRNPEADWHNKQDLWQIVKEGGEPVKILEWTGYIANVTCSPSGEQLALVAAGNSHGTSTSPGIWLIANKPGQKPDDAKNLLAKLDRPAGYGSSSDVRYMAFMPPLKWQDEENIIFLYGDAGSASLANLHLPGGTIDPLWRDPMRAIAAFDATADGLVLQIGSPTRVDELYLLANDEEKQLTTFNQALYEECLVAPCRRLTYKGDKDWDIDGWLVTPPDWDGKTALPTVLMIHGGPHGVYGSGFMFQAQIQATNGLAVFYTNPRGSECYGQEFAYAVVDDWGQSDYRDLMLGVDYLIAQGIADADRLGVMGWSYGGYMSSWIISQTDRFKAALPGAIVGNCHSFYGSSDIGWFFAEQHFGDATPWSDPKKLLSRSALSYADKINTPALFMHGETDLRCPMSQTEELFTALRRQHKTAVMVRYPGEFHSVNQPRHKEDRYGRIVAWFKHHLC